MKLSKFIAFFTLLTIALTIISGAVLTIQADFHAHLFKLCAFFFYSSILLSGNHILLKHSKTTSYTILRVITIADFLLIIFSGLILFDIISFSNSWHLILGISVLYILSIQLNLLGWANSKHSILHKIMFLLVLLTDLFLAALFLFKIDSFEFKPLIISSFTLSTTFLFVGVYFDKKQV